MHPEEEHRLIPRQYFNQTVQLERSRFFTGENAPVHEIGQAIDICPLGLGVKTEAPLQPKEMVRVYFRSRPWISLCRFFPKSGG